MLLARPMANIPRRMQAAMLLVAVAAGIRPAPEASKAALIRRATLDLTGLPPTPEDVAANPASHTGRFLAPMLGAAAGGVA